MYYIIGDIHATLNNLLKLFNKIKRHIKENDILIFLGDYIDRGMDAYEVVEYLISLSNEYNCIFLKGNHEDMFLKYLQGDDPMKIFLSNGGHTTIRSYKKRTYSLKLPISHEAFFNNLRLYYETDHFIAVHAGINPEFDDIKEQTEDDCLWIREKFYHNSRKWRKTIIFGHTPLAYITGVMNDVYFDDNKNIIGIDTGSVYGGRLTCLRMPDKKIFQS